MVDDEKDLVDEMSFFLESSGWEVSTALDGQEGLEKAKKEKPDLILLDILMPKLNGYQVCRELKKEEATKGIPVMMLSAKGQESNKFWGEECGADAYITKPFEKEKLLSKLRELLR